MASVCMASISDGEEMFFVLMWTKRKWTAPTCKRCRNSAEPLSTLSISERTRRFGSFPRISVIGAEKRRGSLKRRDYPLLDQSLPKRGSKGLWWSAGEPSLCYRPCTPACTEPVQSRRHGITQNGAAGQTEAIGTDFGRS